MHSVTVATFDLTNRRRVRVSSTKEKVQVLEAYASKPHGLYFRVRSEKGRWHAMQAHIIPELHLQVVRFNWREGQARDFDYYIDVIRVVEQGECWVVRDLYLDLIVYEGHKVEILDTDEYLAGLAEGHMDCAEAEHALNVTHTTLNMLAEHDYSLEAYLKRHSIRLSWLEDG